MDEWKKRIPKEELESFYQNHTAVDTAKHFNCYEQKIRELIKEYGIPKHSNWTEEAKDRILRSPERRLQTSIAFKNKTPEEKEARIQKIKNTSMLKFGVDNFTKTEEYKLKTIKTNMAKRGVPYHTQTKEWKENQSQIWDSLSEKEKLSIQQKRVNTMNELYGVDYFCIHQDSRNKNKRDSKPNLEFKQLLEENGFLIDEKENREFSLNNYSYDFKINDILIEINPTTTHNSTFGIYGGNPLKQNYHFLKSQNALKNGFKILNVFDWVSKEFIIKCLKYGFEIKERPIKRYLVNINSFQYLESNDPLPDNKWVEIYDDGLDIILKEE